MKLLSIFIPTFERAFECDRCLITLFNALTRHREVCEVFVLLNSPNDSEYDEVIKRHMWCEWVINTGDLSAQRNFLRFLDYGSGEYVHVLADDDRVSERYYPQVLEVLRARRPDFVHLTSAGELVKCKPMPDLEAGPIRYSAIDASVFCLVTLQDLTQVSVNIFARRVFTRFLVARNYEDELNHFSNVLKAIYSSRTFIVVHSVALFTGINHGNLKDFNDIFIRNMRGKIWAADFGPSAMSEEIRNNFWCNYTRDFLMLYISRNRRRYRDFKDVLSRETEFWSTTVLRHLIFKVRPFMYVAGFYFFLLRKFEILGYRQFLRLVTLRLSMASVLLLRRFLV